MKLSELLAERTACRQRIDNLTQRLLNNVKVQEGDEPTEAPEELLGEINATFERLETLIHKISGYNEAVTMPGGGTLADALIRRDVLIKRRGVYASAVEKATSDRDYRMGRMEIREVLTVDVKALQKRIDEISAEYRQLDMAIQAANWTAQVE